MIRKIYLYSPITDIGFGVIQKGFDSGSAHKQHLIMNYILYQVIIELNLLNISK